MIAFADDVLAYVREQHFSVGNDARITVGVDLCVICNQTLDVCLVLDSAKIAPLHFFALIITGCLSESHTVDVLQDIDNKAFKLKRQTTATDRAGWNWFWN